MTANPAVLTCRTKMELIAPYLRLPEFALITARLAALLLVLPFFGALSIPTNLRVLFVAALALLMTPFVRLSQPPTTMLELLWAAAGELMIGALLGAVLAACFLGLQLAGMLIAQETGLAYGSILDPTLDQEETSLGSFYLQFGMAIFLALGGHRAVMAACLDSFRTLPLMSPFDAPGPGLHLVATTITTACELAFRVALPTLLTLFMLNLALGLISRTVPQLNLLSIGFSIKGILGFALMAVGLPFAAEAFVQTLETTGEWIAEVLHG